MRIDGHSHVLLGITGRNEADRSSVAPNRYLPALRDGHVCALGLTVGGDRAYALPDSLGPWAGTLDMMDRFLSGLSGVHPSVGIVQGKHDLDRAAKDAVLMLLHLEGLRVLYDSPFDDPRVGLRLLFGLGVRSLQPIGTTQTPFWDDGFRLTNTAMMILEEATRLGMVLDLSHMTGDEPAFAEITGSFSKPIVMSHGVLRGVHADSPGLAEKTARTIASSGGLIGLPLASHHLAAAGAQATLSDFLRHIDALVKAVGIEHVGIGTDWLNPTRLSLPDSLFLEGFSGYEAFGILEKGLKAHGYSQRSCDAILGENWLRVWRDSLR